jgi:hypothetical protein
MRCTSLCFLLLQRLLWKNLYLSSSNLYDIVPGAVFDMTTLERLLHNKSFTGNILEAFSSKGANGASYIFSPAMVEL